jgi:hypothetical protein
MRDSGFNFGALRARTQAAGAALDGGAAAFAHNRRAAAVHAAPFHWREYPANLAD